MSPNLWGKGPHQHRKVTETMRPPEAYQSCQNEVRDVVLRHRAQCRKLCLAYKLQRILGLLLKA